MSSKDHYNHVATQHPVQCRALRSAHRQAKRVLIEKAVYIASGDISRCSILDLACGRGGDLPKCIGCLEYTGIDTAEIALQELERRAREMSMSVRTIHGDAAYHEHGSTFDLVMCNFALHYFCDTYEHCKALISQVARSLRPGGVFCGTYERLQHRARWGEGKHVVLGDCVNAVEWAVPWHEVQQIAFKLGLALVYHVPLTFLQRQSDRSIWCFIIQKCSCAQDGMPSTPSRTQGASC